MNILVVDDEVYVADGIRQSIDWSSLEIDGVFTAYSMKQAQAVFMQHKIEILVCDIEMPKGSGLDLLGWMREHEYHAVCIFLTSHANFDYAKKAIRLDSMDYILKPAPYEELTKVIQKAVHRVQEQYLNEKRMRMGQYWNDSQVIFAEQFWLRLSQGIITPGRDQIAHEASGLYSDKPFLDLCYCPIILQLIPSRDEARDWERSLIEYTVKNIMDEMLFYNKEITAILRMGEDRYFIIIGVSSDSADQRKLAKQCEEVITACSSIIPHTITCYMDEFVSIENIARSTTQLLSLMETKIPYGNTVYLSDGGDAIYRDMETAELNQWIDGLFSGDFLYSLSRIFIWLDSQEKSKSADRSMLRKLYHDFLQGVFACLDRRKIQAHMIFQDEMSTFLSENATRSIKEMRSWIDHISNKVHEFFNNMESAVSAIDTIKQYIQDHLGEELSRNDIAQQVYLSPDYVSHCFKEKTGISLTDYILMERMKESRKLLRTTNLSISDISLKVGYPSISYFSKIFKRTTNTTPLEYRKQKSNS